MNDLEEMLFDDPVVVDLEDEEDLSRVCDELDADSIDDLDSLDYDPDDDIDREDENKMITKPLPTLLQDAQRLAAQLLDKDPNKLHYFEGGYDCVEDEIQDLMRDYDIMAPVPALAARILLNDLVRAGGFYAAGEIPGQEKPGAQKKDWVDEIREMLDQSPPPEGAGGSK